MNLREAINILEKSGYNLIRHGSKHMIFQSKINRFILPTHNKLSPGIVGKLRSIYYKSEKLT